MKSWNEPQKSAKLFPSANTFVYISGYQTTLKDAHFQYQKRNPWNVS